MILFDKDIAENGFEITKRFLAPKYAKNHAFSTT